MTTCASSNTVSGPFPALFAVKISLSCRCDFQSVPVSTRPCVYGRSSRCRVALLLTQRPFPVQSLPLTRTASRSTSLDPTFNFNSALYSCNVARISGAKTHWSLSPNDGSIPRASNRSARILSNSYLSAPAQGSVLDRILHTTRLASVSYWPSNAREQRPDFGSCSRRPYYPGVRQL